MHQVIARANNTRFGLGASVWGVDTGKALQLAQELQVLVLVVLCSTPELRN